MLSIIKKCLIEAGIIAYCNNFSSKTGQKESDMCIVVHKGGTEQPVFCDKKEKFLKN
jgi:hypothetical protein